MWWTVNLSGGPRRVNHSAVSVNERIYSFGGYCTGDNYKDKQPIDVFLLNTFNYRWTQLSKPQEEDPEYLNWPYQRYGHSVSAYGHDKVILFGGRNDTTLCNTTFIFNTSTHRWSKPEVMGTKPAERDGHTSCVIKDAFYVFGGYEEYSLAREVYKLDLVTMTWTLMKCNGLPPLYRDFHSATPIGDKMFIFGGRSEFNSREHYPEKISYLDTGTNTWVHPEIIHHDRKPLGRRSHSAVEYRGKLLIFGGYNGNHEVHKNDLWALDVDDMTWKELLPLGPGPPPRRRQALCKVGHRLFLFGGTSPYNGPPIQFTDEQMQYLPPNNDNTLSKLIDHNDLYVLDLSPSLKTLCLLSVIKHKLQAVDYLPKDLKMELESMTRPNIISKPLKTLPLG